MSGSVWDGKPAAIALTVELAEADADARPETVEDGVAEADDVLVGALCADPAAGPPHAAIASAAAASAVAPASLWIRRVMSAISVPYTFRLPIEVLPSLVGFRRAPRPTMVGWRRRTTCLGASRWRR